MNDLMKGWGSAGLDALACVVLGTASFFAIETLMPRQGQAEGTWIEIFRELWGTPPPGSVAEKAGIHGVVAYIDVRSIVRRGVFAYFNIDGWFLNEDGLRLTLPYVEPQPPRGWEAKCRTQQMRISASDEWKSWDHEYVEAARIACR